MRSFVPHDGVVGLWVEGSMDCPFELVVQEMSRQPESSCLGFKEVGGVVMWECCATILGRGGRDL